VEKVEDENMKCRGCDRELVDGEDYRMVAEWAFCAPCFENLMKGPGEPAERQPAEGAAPAPEREGSAPSPVLCSVCKRPLRPEEGKKLGIWSFCPECYGDLESFARAVESPDDEGAGEDGAEGAGTAAQAVEEPEGGVAGVTIELAKYIRCKGCGRRIPQGGSKTVDGEPYCPDCYYALADEKEGKSAAPPVPASPDQTDQSGIAPRRDGEDRCACCDRPLRKDSGGEVEGFALCRACLSTDPDLAVRIARERHRRLLAGIMEGLKA